ncbi:MAG TPA: phosphoribosylformylglycinamidine synthase subunit PurS [Spirochaetota bacterium]|nr:phosphoribosylformylglycinamidine synthase subunit PurS [Spirochaetota bacterium]HOM38567.1 phosphoribosylformylglycinamidine synthase subunit PurS [Spirochaetota bacterium]HPQ49704.1 phosphoribosylformylglycinamidine synthase subunit PurS [Spirochaetota bacterium]
MKYRVILKLKPNVLDPEGNTIKEAGLRIGFNNIKDIRVGKVFEIEIDGNIEDAKTITEKLLLNPVIETYEIEETK